MVHCGQELSRAIDDALPKMQPPRRGGAADRGLAGWRAAPILAVACLCPSAPGHGKLASPPRLVSPFVLLGILLLTVFAMEVCHLLQPHRQES